jgi:cytochrome c
MGSAPLVSGNLTGELAGKLACGTDETLQELLAIIILERFALMRNFFLLSLALLCPLSVSHAAGDAEAGQLVFKRCAACHQVGPAARGGFGPQLNNLFGRRAGSAADYNYSAAMKASGIVWSEQTLSAFIRDPDELVPGNKMRFWGMGNDKQIADLLAYLKTFSKIDLAK